MKIVVVESPAKAKTINKYLGPGYSVLASFGHVRDLPAKDGSVDPEANFHMLWEVDPKAQKRLNDIAKAVKGADSLILATDPDREGEAISWHVLEVLKEMHVLKKQSVERVVFNAITKQAVAEAMQHPRAIDCALVDAYLARRALDYLVGFTLSPVLWRKLPGARSAGRVQSVALRLVCDRELEIEKFIPREYWSLIAKLATPRGEEFEARLVGADGEKIQRLDIGSGARAEDLKRALESAAFTVASVEAKPARRNPPPPFTTSTMQQEASRKLGFAPAHTMRLAQRLYEGIDIDGETVGLITYMRTDGIDMAEEAIAAIRQMIGGDYGASYVPDAPRRYQNKSKNAQEAHEAVRPTDPTRSPRDVARAVEPEQAKLYELIWNRAVASQMQSAELERTTVDIAAQAGGRNIELRATGQVIKFDGFLKLYHEDFDDPNEAGEDDESRRLPAMSQGEKLDKKVDRRQPALHRTAAALFRSLAGQAHGRTRHRPAVDLCLDPAGAARTAATCGSTRSGSCPRTKVACSPHSWKISLPAMSNTISPPISKNNSIASPTTRSPGAMCCAISGADFTGAVGEIKDLRITASDRRARRHAGAPHLSAARRRHRSAPMSELRAPARSRSSSAASAASSAAPTIPNAVTPASSRSAPTETAAACASSAKIPTPALKSPSAADDSAAICSSAKPPRTQTTSP